MLIRRLLMVLVLAIASPALARTPHHQHFPFTPINTPVPADALPPPGTGVANPAVTQGNIDQTICQVAHPGFPTTWVHRQRPPTSYTNRIKLELFTSLHLPGRPGDYELDHAGPIEDSGDPRNRRNLWMQRSTGPWNARDKDRLENEVHRRICSHQITVAQGLQDLIGPQGWVVSYRRYFSH